jgi:hypothetical protein
VFQALMMFDVTAIMRVTSFLRQIGLGEELHMFTKNKFQVTEQMLRDLSLLVYDDGNFQVGKELLVHQTSDVTQNVVVLDQVIGDITSPGLEAFAVAPKSEYWWWQKLSMKPRHLLLVVRGSGDDLVNDWVTADVGELTGMSKPLQSTGLLTFVKYMLALYKGKRTETFMTGHSLGGALTQKVVAVHAHDFTKVVTFAAANGFNLLTPAEQENAEQLQVTNYYHIRDTVHQLPPLMSRFVGTQVALDYDISQLTPEVLKLGAKTPKKVVEMVAYHDLGGVPFDENGTVSR